MLRKTAAAVVFVAQVRLLEGVMAGGELSDAKEGSGEARLPTPRGQLLSAPVDADTLIGDSQQTNTVYSNSGTYTIPSLASFAASFLLLLDEDSKAASSASECVLETALTS